MVQLVVTLAGLAAVYGVLFKQHRNGYAPLSRAAEIGDRDSILGGSTWGKAATIAVVAADIAELGGASVLVLVGLAAVTDGLTKDDSPDGRAEGRGGLFWSLLLGLLGMFALWAGLTELVAGECGVGVSPTLVFMVVGTAAAVLSFAFARLLGRPLVGVVEVGPFLAGLVGVWNLAAFVGAPAGLAVWRDAMGTTDLVLQVSTLVVFVVVATGIGLRPRFGAPVLSLMLLVGMLALTAGPVPCGFELGWYLTAIMVWLGFQFSVQLLRRMFGRP